MAKPSHIPSSQCKPNPQAVPERNSLEAIIRLYLSRKQQSACDAGPCLNTIIDFICGVNNDGHKSGEKYKKHPHQRRMTNTTVENAEAHLVDLDKMSFDSFEKLVSEVERRKKIPEKVDGFGNLAIYDFSLRFGKKYGILPAEFVYIHQGARTGAKILYGKGLLAVRPTGTKIPTEAFPKELQKLGAEEIEDFLCVMRPQLEKL